MKAQIEISTANEIKTALANLLGDYLIDIKLFGSRARNEAHEESDMDILVLLNQKLPRELDDEYFNILGDIELKYLIPISPLTLTIEQYNDMKDRELLIIDEIEKYGISI